MARLFLSYSHADESDKKELLAHMANLRREGNHIWHDRELVAGDQLDPEIKKELQSADLILLLISHHFLDSYYCFEIEFQTAIARANTGEARVIPIILDHCDWTATEIPKRLALPTDGKPVATWNNRNEAYLNIVSEIRCALKAALKPTNPPIAQTTFSPTQPQELGPSLPSIPQAPKTFTDLDKRRAAESEFTTIRSYFQKGMALIEAESNELNIELTDITTQRFAATLYRQGNVLHEIVVWRGGSFDREGISYNIGQSISHTGENSFSGWITFEETPEKLVPALSSTNPFNHENSELSPAESLWKEFVQPLEYS